MPDIVNVIWLSVKFWCSLWESFEFCCSEQLCCLLNNLFLVSMFSRYFRGNPWQTYLQVEFIALLRHHSSWVSNNRPIYLTHSLYSECESQMILDPMWLWELVHFQLSGNFSSLRSCLMFILVKFHPVYSQTNNQRLKRTPMLTSFFAMFTSLQDSVLKILFT